MGFTDHGTPVQTSVVFPPPRLPEGELTVEPATPRHPGDRVNWLFSGVLLGAASWMLVLGIVFAAIGNWIVAGALLGGIVLCGIAIWRAGRRATHGLGPGRHRADGGSTAS